MKHIPGTELPNLTVEGNFMPFELFLATTFLELYLLYRYFTVLFYAPNRKNWITGLAYTVAGGIIFFSSVSFLPVLITGLLLFSIFLLISLLYSAPMKYRVFFSFLYLLLGFIAEWLSYQLILFFQGLENTNHLTASETRFLLLAASSLMMLYFIIILQVVRCRKYTYQLEKTSCFAVLCVILFNFIILKTTFFYAHRNWLYPFSVIGIIGINFLIVFLFNRLMEKNRLADESRRLLKQIEYQRNNGEKTAHSFKNMKRILHDTKKHAVFIRACIQEQRDEEAIAHLNQMLEHMNSAYLRVTTGNLVIDALVSHSLQIAYDSGITMKYDIRIDASDIFLERYDLCIVLGNVLDNAIEAAQLVTQKEDRFIHLNISSNSQALFIQVINARRGENRFLERTCKDNPHFHGIGLSNIQRVAKKYGGYLQTSPGNRRFDTVVVLPFIKD
ncbi:sensor histidine kinase [Paenibacillus thiaminolyticus]|uniref:sensor histidine kinase n=1 Tax=Paenibacillus thiaminolyticus TaxID=49283 RepID=UPI002543C65F|nr:sensor histidine kinase [Paenibacillus thiaminolyticus]WII39976.1 GHKL domain-containing protein [Paenibacillus thiaminolyticus]